MRDTDCATVGLGLVFLLIVCMAVCPRIVLVVWFALVFMPVQLRGLCTKNGSLSAVRICAILELLFEAPLKNGHIPL